MISRIRIDAYGKTPNEVADTLYPHANEIEKLIGHPIGRGECVIEAQLNEPPDSDFAFKGRLNLHVSIDPQMGNATTANWSGHGSTTAYFDGGAVPKLVGA